MTTTPVFVELLTIGFGTLAGVFLAVAGCFGYNPLGSDHGLFALADPIVWLIPTLTLAYVFGVITDRIADRLFNAADEKDLRCVFGGDRKRYYELRRTLALHGNFLWANLEYGRSRMRICRGWVVNSALLAVGSSLYLLGSASSLSLSVRRLVICLSLVMLGFVILAALCRMCCLELNRKEYQKIKRQVRWIENQLAGKGLESEKE